MYVSLSLSSSPKWKNLENHFETPVEKAKTRRNENAETKRKCRNYVADNSQKLYVVGKSQSYCADAKRSTAGRRTFVKGIFEKERSVRSNSTQTSTTWINAQKQGLHEERRNNTWNRDSRENATS